MKLLLGIDFSGSTEKVTVKTMAIAGQLSARIWILHVAEPEPFLVGYEPGPQSVRDSQAGQFHEEHRRIQDIANRMRAAGLEATALLIQGPTVATILQKAAELEADMIIVGSHGKGALYHLLAGSVSRGVLAEANCPVLVIPTRESQE